MKRSDKPATWRSGIVLGILTGLIQLVTGVILFFLIGLGSIGKAHPPSDIELIIRASLPGIAILLFAITIRSAFSPLSKSFWIGLSVSFLCVLGLAFIVFEDRQRERNRQIAIQRQAEKEQHEQATARIKTPAALRDLQPPITDEEERVLWDRVQRADIPAEVLEHLLSIDPKLACAIAKNPNTTGQQLAAIRVLKSCSPDVFLQHAHTTDATLQDIQDHEKDAVSAKARVVLASRSCDPLLLRADGEWAGEQTDREVQESMERALLINPCAPMSAFESNADFKAGSPRFLNARSFPHPRRPRQIYMQTPFEPDYMIRSDGEVFDRVGIEYFAQRSCDPHFLSALFHREVGSGDGTRDPFTHFNRSGLDFVLVNNPCTPEEIIMRLRSVMEPGPSSRSAFERVTAMRATTRGNRTIARAQDWKDPDCVLRKEGMCKRYSEGLHPPSGYKDIARGYLSGLEPR